MKNTRQSRRKVRLFREGKCISCGKERGESQFLRRCEECGIKDRERKRKQTDSRPWQIGRRGRPPAEFRPKKGEMNEQASS